MKKLWIVFVGFWSLSFLGCVSQQAHERVMEELEITKSASSQEIERLQHSIYSKQEEISKLEESLHTAIEVKKAEVSALEEKARTLEGSLDERKTEVTRLEQTKEELEQVMDSQKKDFLKLGEQNRLLEQELDSLEIRLQEVDQLKAELQEYRKAREMHETQVAKVKQEVLTVEREIDKIAKSLEEKFGKSLVVTLHQDRLVLTMLGQVLFEIGEAELSPLGMKIMKEVGQVLATLPEKYIQVEGHTDNNPIYGQLQLRYPTNWELSTARATTVLRYLIEQSEMDRRKFSAAGYADTRPVRSNETKEGQGQNRRVEIVLYPERVLQQSEKLAPFSR